MHLTQLSVTMVDVVDGRVLGQYVVLDRYRLLFWKVALERGLGVVFFFFQAEDGIRDLTVTGVQTCALPIYLHGVGLRWAPHRAARRRGPAGADSSEDRRGGSEDTGAYRGAEGRPASARMDRSEERRVGKSVDLGGRRIIKKKKKGRQSRWHR